jgi:hypothetical protein
MTEAEWLACDDPRALLTCVWDNASDRKLILFACACVRRISDFREANLRKLLRRSLAIYERYADGLITVAEVRRATGRSVVEYPRDWAWEHTHSVVPEVTLEYRSALVREIFGNPFRPVALDPACLTSDVLALAQHLRQAGLRPDADSGGRDSRRRMHER